MEKTCEKCNKVFATKYTLKKHVDSKICENSMPIEPVYIPCTSNRCEYKTQSKSDMQKHLKTCRHIEIDAILKKVNEVHQKEIETLKIDHIREIEQLQTKTYCIEKENERLTHLFEKIVARQTQNLHTSIEEKESDKKSPLSQKLDRVADSIVNVNTENISIVSTITLNSVTITSRHPDHYVNATELCQAGDKKFSHWISLDSTKELINALESDAGIPASLLVETKRGQTSKFIQGSWIHPDLAIQLAQWISPVFALQVSRWVRELFNNGTLAIDLQLIKHQQDELKTKDGRIKQLEDVCLSKRKRKEYPEHNVIYLLTTDEHIKHRTYIIGKAKNLTNRLSTYNKTCDHHVIHYRECKNEDDMATAESLILGKLKDFREQANRDRFVLPVEKDVDFFINEINKCIDFL